MQQRFAALRATPITVNLTQPASVRDVLDAICQSEGTLSWQVQPKPLGSTIELTLSSYNGWGLSQVFAYTNAPGPMKAVLSPPAIDHGPRVKIATELDRDVDSRDDHADAVSRKGVRHPGGTGARTDGRRSAAGAAATAARFRSARGRPRIKRRHRSRSVQGSSVTPCPCCWDAYPSTNCRRNMASSTLHPRTLPVHGITF